MLRSALKSQNSPPRRRKKGRITWKDGEKMEHIRFFDAKSPASHNRGENFRFNEDAFTDEQPPWETLHHQSSIDFRQARPSDTSSSSLSATAAAPVASFKVPPRRPRRKSWEIPQRDASGEEGQFPLPPRRPNKTYIKNRANDKVSGVSDAYKNGDETNEFDENSSSRNNDVESDSSSGERY